MVLCLFSVFNVTRYRWRIEALDINPVMLTRTQEARPRPRPMTYEFKRVKAKTKDFSSCHKTRAKPNKNWSLSRDFCDNGTVPKKTSPKSAQIKLLKLNSCRHCQTDIDMRQ